MSVQVVEKVPCRYCGAQIERTRFTCSACKKVVSTVSGRQFGKPAAAPVPGPEADGAPAVHAAPPAGLPAAAPTKSGPLSKLRWGRSSA
jgi:hypothetical protein